MNFPSSRILGFKVVEKFEKYLGMPTVIGRSKKAIFNGIVDRVRRKLQGWKERLLSKPGKEVLIKAVAQSIPTYLMSIFKLPEGIIDELHSSMARFWWGSCVEKRKMHWVTWDKLCDSKSRGGLGFRNLHDFNQALLAKQVWRIQTHPMALVSRILKARYFKRGSILEAHRGYNPSYTWRSIWGAKPVILDGIGWRVGNGSSLGVMSHSWVPSDDIRALGIPNLITDVAESMTVSDLIDATNNEWDKARLFSLFRAEDVKKILSIPLSRRMPKDEVYWRSTNDGQYSVKTGYFLCRSRPSDTADDDEKFWKTLWHFNAPPKLIHFIWRACKGMLAVRKILFNIHCAENAACPLCQEDEETLNHAFFDCSTVKNVWNASGVALDWRDIDALSFKERVKFFLSNFVGSELISLLATMWAVWSIRNNAIFEEPCTRPNELRMGYDQMVRDYIQYKNDVCCAGSANSGSGAPSWGKPEVGWIKANVDAAVMEDGSVGLGIVMRDEVGGVLMVASRRIEANWSVNVAEARALLFGMDVAAKAGKRKVIMEGDSMNVILAVKDKGSNRTHFGLCIDDIKEACAMFESVKFVHVKRSGNTVAHFSARLCQEIGGDVLYVNSIPDAILALAELDII